VRRSLLGTKLTLGPFQSGQNQLALFQVIPVSQAKNYLLHSKQF
jgi:hypothetical protein